MQSELFGLIELPHFLEQLFLLLDLLESLLLSLSDPFAVKANSLITLDLLRRVCTTFVFQNYLLLELLNLNSRFQIFLIFLLTASVQEVLIGHLSFVSKYLDFLVVYESLHITQLRHIPVDLVWVND